MRLSALRGKEDDIERRLRVLGLHAEGDEFRRLGSAGDIDDTTLRRLVRELDHQEARYGAQ